MKDVYSVLVGGTFDVFHKGHRLLIEKAISEGNTVIGITSDSLANKSRSRTVNPFSERAEAVREFATEIAMENDAEFTTIEIDTPNGPVYTGEQYDTIVVSPESKTIDRVNKINDIRIENGLDKLDIKVVEPFYAEDDQRISSTRIRNGIIDRNGNLIKKDDELAIISDIHYGHAEQTKSAILETLTQTLREVYGRKIVVVGDIIHENDENTDIENLQQVVNTITEHAKQDVYFVPGNHDVQNIDRKTFEEIVGHEIPQTVDINTNTRLHLVDSAFQSEYDNIGYISDDSIQTVRENVQDDGNDIVVSHFLTEYTDIYKQSDFFDEHPEGVFPMNNFEYQQQVDLDQINMNIYAHLHILDNITYTHGKKKTIINAPITKNPIHETEPNLNTNYRIIDI